MPVQRTAPAELMANKSACARAKPNEAKALPGRRAYCRFSMHGLSIRDVSTASAQSVIPCLATYSAILKVLCGTPIARFCHVVLPAKNEMLSWSWFR
jgi:hypothetical protein